MIKTKKLNLLLSCAFLSCACLTSCGCPHDGTKTFVSDTAKCEEDGTATYVCDECGKTITEKSYALGHDFSVFVSDSATCTKDGYKTYKCSRCDKTKTIESSATGHNFDGCICSKCGKADDDCYVKTMTDSLSFSQQYVLTSGYTTIASVFCTLKMSPDTSYGTFGVVGTFYKSCFFAMTIYGSDGKFLGNGSISVFVSYSGMDSKTRTIDLSHGIASGETFYLKIKGSAF